MKQPILILHNNGKMEFLKTGFIPIEILDLSVAEKLKIIDVEKRKVLSIHHKWIDIADYVTPYSCS